LRAVSVGGVTRDLLSALFFLFVFFRDFFLTLLELVIWFGQKVTFDRRKGRME